MFLLVVDFGYPMYLFIDDLIISPISIRLFVYKFSFKNSRFNHGRLTSRYVFHYKKSLISTILSYLGISLIFTIY